MSCRTILIVAVFAALATVILSTPTNNPVLQVLDRPYPELAQPLPVDLTESEKEIVAEYVADKMQEVYPNVEPRANLFNLSAYLNTNRPNTTALTFVPLITLISGFFTG